METSRLITECPPAGEAKEQWLREWQQWAEVRQSEADAVKAIVARIRQELRRK